MIFVQSARIGRGELQVTLQVPDPDNEGQMKEQQVPMDVVMVNLNLGPAGDLEIAVDPELGEKMSAALGRASGPQGAIVPADLSQMPKAPFGKRDGVPQQPR